MAQRNTQVVAMISQFTLRFGRLIHKRQATSVLQVLQFRPEMNFGQWMNQSSVTSQKVLQFESWYRAVGRLASSMRLARDLKRLFQSADLCK
jgi:hypothetical protein